MKVRDVVRCAFALFERLRNCGHSLAAAGATTILALCAIAPGTAAAQSNGFGACSTRAAAMPSGGAPSVSRSMADTVRNDARLARWMNVGRPGHGWDITASSDYAGGSAGQTALIWYTYDAANRPFWLMAQNPLPEGQNFLNQPLKVIQKSDLGPQSAYVVGTVSITFNQLGDANLAQAVWTITDSAMSGRLGVTLNQSYTECIVQLAKATTGIATPPGPSEAYSGLWKFGDGGLVAGQTFDGQGLALYFNRAFRDRDLNGRPDQDVEFDQAVLSIHRADSYPTWLVAQSDTAGVRPRSGATVIGAISVNNGYCAACAPPSGIWAPTSVTGFSLTRTLPNSSTGAGTLLRNVPGTIVIGSGTNSVAVNFDTFGVRALDRVTTSRYDLARPVSAPLPAAEPAFTAAEQAVVDAGTQVGATSGVFRINESGATTYSVPLFTGPGLGGVAPKLSLDYSSQAGDGELGVGWRIGGLSTISRCRKSVEAGDGSGPHPPVSFTAADAFCLDGQRLIQVATGVDAGVEFREFRTEIESFQRVISVKEGVLDPAWFGVWGADGSYREFGRSATSRLYANANGIASTTAVMSWAEGQFSNNVGNTIQYLYTKNDSAGEQYLTRVEYTTNPAAALTLPFGVIEFTYPTNRTAPQVQYMSGAKLTSQVLLGNAKVKYTMPGQTERTVRYYELAYQDSTATTRKRVQSITECADSTKARCYAPTTFQWSSARQSLATDLEGNAVDRDTQAGSRKGFKLADVDGDSRTDLIWIENQGSNPKKLFVSRQLLLGSGIDYQYGTIQTAVHIPDKTGGILNDISDAGRNNRTWHAFDFTGDGRDDLLALSGASASEQTPRQSYTWRIFPSDGAAFTSTGAIDLGLTEASADEAILADVTGDGLPDFIHSEASSQNQLYVRDMVRCSTGACPAACTGAVYCFSNSARRLDFRNVSVPGFPGICPGRTLEHALNNPERLQVFDVNGDGRADIRVKFSVPNDGTCTALMQSPAADSPAGNGRVRAWLVFVNAGTVGSGAAAVEAFDQFATWDIDVDGNGDGFRTAGDDDAFHMGDINGDGLSDVLFRETKRIPGNEADRWWYQLNTGNTLTSRVLLTGAPYDVDDSKVAIQDYDGDGRADLLLPLASDDRNGTKCGDPGDQRYVLLRWNGSGFDPRICLPDAFSAYQQEGAQTLATLADLDGDGGLDLLRLADSGRLVIRRNESASRYRPRDVVVSVANGLGAVTRIDHAPLTFSTVYRRQYFAPTQNYGRLSPVFDVIAPVYVATNVWSSSPNVTTVDEAQVRYLYSGARAQGGGRGWLGFNSVVTIDMQSSGIPGAEQGTLTTTFYHQYFPYVGRTWKTLSSAVPYTVSESFSGLGHCDSPDSALCMPPRSTSTPGPVSDPPPWDLWPAKESGAPSRLSSTEDYWTSSTTHGGRVSYVRQQSTSRKTYLGGSFAVRHESTTFFPGGVDGYDAFGNVMRSTLTVSDCSGTPIPMSDCHIRPIQTTAVVNTYDTGSSRISAVGTTKSPRWQLGRLTSSETTTSAGSQTAIRTSRFEYATNGLLTVERRLPTSSDATVRLNTFHYHDSVGNERLVLTCGGDAADAGACVAVNATTWLPSSVPAGKYSNALPYFTRRYVRTNYDVGLRFPTSIDEPFTVSTGDIAQNRTAQTVSTRSELGEPILVTTATGLTARSTYTGLGRKVREYANTGSSTKTLIQWCDTRTDVTAPKVKCPAGFGAAYRIAITDPSGPARYGYFDVLGREFLSVKQALEDGTFSATMTEFDPSGRVMRQSMPYFTFEPASAQIGEPTAGTTRYSALTVYDVQGRALSVSSPLPVGVATTTTQYTGYITRTVDPEGKAREEERNVLGQRIRSTDHLNLSTCFTYDLFGNALTVKRSSDLCATTFASLTRTEYDDANRPTKAFDADRGGYNHPSGWTTVYNPAGEVIKQTSPRGTCVFNTYDVRGRLTWQRDFDNATCTGTPGRNITFGYDVAKAGLLDAEYLNDDSVTYAGQSISHAYDVFGRPLSKTTAVGSWQGSSMSYVYYREWFTYDAVGRPFQYFDASTPYGYDPYAVPDSQESTAAGTLNEYQNGYLFRVRELTPGVSGEIYWQARRADAFGNITEEWRAVRQSGSGAYVPDHTVVRKFEPQTGRPEKSETWATTDGVNVAEQGARVRLLSYTFDKVGNLKTRGEEMPWAGATGGSLASAETFGYDDLHRLTSLSRTGSGATGSPLSYQYDALGVGNLVAKPGVGALTYGVYDAAGCTGGVGVSSTPGPHAITKLVATTTTHYCYDANGNQVWSSAARTLRYNNQDQVRQISTSGGVMTKFWYGATGSRYRRADTGTADPRDTHYLGSVEVNYRSGQAIEYKRSIAGVLVLTWRSDLSGQRDYLLKDHLGSTEAIVDRFGNLEIDVRDPTTNALLEHIGQRMSFEPFGWRRSWNTMANLDAASVTAFNTRPRTSRGFTGHEQVDNLGLIHMNGRMYDPWVGRFVQADPIVQDYANPQSLNRYTYVLNNPLSFTDPTGYASMNATWRSVVAIAVIAFTGGWAAGLYASLPALSTSAAWAVAVSGGAIAGAVQTGTMRGALIGAVSAAAFHGIGSYYRGMAAANAANGTADAVYRGLTAPQFASNVALSSVAGGVMSDLQGGKFGHGMASAGLSTAASPAFDHISSPAGQVVVAAMIGGTASSITGGKFANGAVTAAFAYAFSNAARGGDDMSVGSGPGATSAAGVDVSIEQDGFPTGHAAGVGFGAHVSADTAANNAEYLAGIVRIGRGNWGFTNPQAGAAGAKTVNVAALHRALRAQYGSAYRALAHSHFDGNLHFSSYDVRVAKVIPLYLHNRAGDTRFLDAGGIQRAIQGTRGANALQSYLQTHETMPGVCVNGPNC